MEVIIVLSIIIVIIVLIIVNSVKIVPQAHAYVIESFGSYKVTWHNGIHFKLPFVERIAGKVSLKERVVDFRPQPVITRDNVTIQIDTVVYYQVTDPKSYQYGVERPLSAIENLTATTLRNIIGDLELDQSLTSREHVNSKMRQVLDEATDPWGIKINRVELKNIIPPSDIQQAMEKQMRAERERREAILRAEGQRESEILTAEGQKKAEILKAEGEKESKILRAEGQAIAIKKINEATAYGLEQIKAVKADKSLIALKSLESLEKVADGKSTKIIVPSNIQGLAGLATSLQEIITTESPEKEA